MTICIEGLAGKSVSCSLSTEVDRLCHSHNEHDVDSWTELLAVDRVRHDKVLNVEQVADPDAAGLAGVVWRPELDDDRKSIANASSVATSVHTRSEASS